MLCERVLGRWNEELTAGLPARLDWLDVTWDQCHRRAIRGVTRKGQPLKLLLRLGITLRHLDIIVDAPDRMIVINLLPVETLVVLPRSPREAALVALEWGNMHLPVEISKEEIITLADGPAEAVVQQRGLDWTAQLRRFAPIRISGMSWSVGDQSDAVDPQTKSITQLA
jgi:urease accessory protein UreE